MKSHTLTSVLIADYAGHPFQIQLSRSLARRGIRTCHAYCPDVPTGRGRLQPSADDPPALEIVPVGVGRRVERYRPALRAYQELKWGWRLSREVRRRKPQAVVLSNLPLLSQLVATAARRRATRLVLWQQDVHSVAIRAVARRHLGRFGVILGWLATQLEAIPARAADAVLAISPAFRPVLLAWGVDDRAVVDFPNWAPLEELPPRPRNNSWRASRKFGEVPLVIYSGTLGLKHDPEVLVRVADQLKSLDADARLVLISEGIGREYIERVQRSRPDLPIITMDYQPYEQLPEVLGAADVLLVVLEAGAGSYSVPSKVLTYLCAGRPVLGVVPAENLASATITEAGAGIVLDPAAAGPESLRAALGELLRDADQYGASARRFAEASFGIEARTDAFIAAVTGALRGTH